YNTVFGTILRIFANDGLIGFFSGLLPELIYQSLYRLSAHYAFSAVKSSTDLSENDLDAVKLIVDCLASINFSSFQTASFLLSLNSKNDLISNDDLIGQCK
ncbi:MAG: hypothetical protein MHPSP_003864, partial [Paramarteilia canceri]